MLTFMRERGDRLRRVIHRLASFFLPVASDPVKVIEDWVTTLRDQLPRMNEAVAAARAAVTLTERETQRARLRLAELSGKAQESARAGRDSEALRLVAGMEGVRTSLARAELQLPALRASHEKVVMVRRGFLREAERATTEALRDVAGERRARWRAALADAFAAGESGIDATHDELVAKIEERLGGAEPEAMAGDDLAVLEALKATPRAKA
jgi:hypothetical protein